MERKTITPMMEFVYPNRGGYTGFSVLVWGVAGEIPGSYMLVSPWGSADREAQDAKSNYVLEARFFVFGSLLGNTVEGRDFSSETDEITFFLLAKWKPLMDKITDTEKRLWGEEGRTGIHIDEVVNDELRDAVKGAFEYKTRRWTDCCDAYKAYRSPDFTDGSYGEYKKIASFKRAEKGDWK